MSDDLKAKSNEELVAHLESLAQTSFWNASDRPLRDAHRAELLRRLEAGEKAKAALNLAETTRESWRKEAEALEAEVEGLTAERDHHRVANEGLRARVAELEGLWRRYIKLRDREHEPTEEERFLRREEDKTRRLLRKTDIKGEGGTEHG